MELVVGIDHETLGVARVTVPDGEHLLVAGPARSGRTTVLLRLAESWLEAHPGGRVLVVGRRDQLGLAGADAVAPDRLAAAVQVATGRPVLVVVDDAEHVDDPALAGLVAARRPGLLVLAAGRPVTLRAMYGHWTSVVRRSRLGLLMAACSDTDGDLLGELLPRHRPLPARPGLAWVVDGGHRRLVQVGWRPDAQSLTNVRSRSAARSDWTAGVRAAAGSSSRLRNASRQDSLRPVCSTERS